jgi:hypothetical protein
LSYLVLAVVWLVTGLVSVLGLLGAGDGSKGERGHASR